MTQSSKKENYALELADIQGVVLRGYGTKNAAFYLLFNIDAPNLARQYLARTNWTSAETAALKSKMTERVLNLALTHQGLKRLELPEALLSDFPRSFVEGMDTPERARILGDRGVSQSSEWAWGASEKMPCGVILGYCNKEELSTFVAELKSQLKASGISPLELTEDELPGGVVEGALATSLLDKSHEHFGFRDGIANPALQGGDRTENSGDVIAGGEGVLGYPDEYGYANAVPGENLEGNYQAWGKNGSFLAFRTMTQDVEGFWRFCIEQSEIHQLDPIFLASKMVGRWPSGASLALYPDADPVEVPSKKLDGFGYTKDPKGYGCPFGAHMRRTNPRDWNDGDGAGVTAKEAASLSRKHRVIRRGRTFGEGFLGGYRSDIPAMIHWLKEQPSVDTAAERDERRKMAPRGIHFLAICTNLERQFEFVHQQWSNNPKFAGLISDPDPLFGAEALGKIRDLEEPAFTIPTADGAIRCTGLKRFVEIRGGQYFFIPSLRALKKLG